MAIRQDNEQLDRFLRRLVVSSRSQQQKVIGAGLRVLQGQSDDALLYSANQSAKLLNCSRQTIWRLQQEGLLRPVSIRGLKRYRRSDLLFLAEGKGADHART